MKHLNLVLCKSYRTNIDAMLNDTESIANNLHFQLSFYRYLDVTIPLSLLNKLLPGPVTVLFKRKSSLNANFNSFTDVIGYLLKSMNLLVSTCIASICEEI